VVQTRAGYILLIVCPEDIELQLGSLGEIKLQKGAYLYVGSANLKKPITRVLRHFNRNKKIHWHIDHLTKKCDSLLALLCFGIDENTLYEILKSFNKVVPAVPKFGSTDKILHKTHLFKLLVRELTAVSSLTEMLVKICSYVEIISISDKYCFSQALLSQL